MTIGVLALQGDWRAHGSALDGAHHRWRPVRTTRDLTGLTGLVLPGGESTTMLRLLALSDLTQPLDRFLRSGAPVLATCAGVVLAARSITGVAQRGFGWLDITVERNAWGRQICSFVDRGRPFIRAPRIREVGAACTVLDTVRGEPALVRQRQVYGATFHPELTSDTTLLDMIFGAPR